MKRQLEEEKFSLIEMEAKLAKKQWKNSNTKTHFQSLNAYIDLTTLEKLRDMVEKLIEDFRDFEKDLGMQKFLMKRGCQWVDDFEKEHVRVSLGLKEVISQLEVLEFQILRNVLWVKGLAKQINLMSNGVGVTSTPMPLKNPNPCLLEVSVPSLLKPTILAQVFMLATTFWCCLMVVHITNFVQVYI